MLLLKERAEFSQAQQRAVAAGTVRVSEALAAVQALASEGNGSPSPTGKGRSLAPPKRGSPTGSRRGSPSPNGGRGRGRSSPSRSSPTGRGGGKSLTLPQMRLKARDAERTQAEY